MKIIKSPLKIYVSQLPNFRHHIGLKIVLKRNVKCMQILNKMQKASSTYRNV